MHGDIMRLLSPIAIFHQLWAQVDPWGNSFDRSGGALSTALQFQENFNHETFIDAPAGPTKS